MSTTRVVSPRRGVIAIEDQPQLRYVWRMAFEDLAKRMGAKRGREVGDGSPIDPDRIMAEAQEAARRSQRISDLVLART